MASTSFSTFGRMGGGLANVPVNMAAMTDQVRIIAGSVAEIGRAVAPAAAPNLREFLDAVGLRGLPLPSLANARTCSLPSCECPSPDLGEVRRVAEKPEDVAFAIRLRNTSDKPREFRFELGKLEAEDGQDSTDAKLSPPTLSLEPGDSGVIRIDGAGRKLRTGVDYCGRVAIRAENCEPMHLGICVRVQPATERVPTIDLHCCCEPKLRPLRWYHHYYCDPPRQDRPKPSPQPKPSPRPVG